MAESSTQMFPRFALKRRDEGADSQDSNRKPEACLRPLGPSASAPLITGPMHWPIPNTTVSVPIAPVTACGLKRARE